MEKAERRRDQQHVQETADGRLSDDQPHDQAGMRLVGQDPEPVRDLSERRPAARAGRAPPVRLLPHEGDEDGASEADRRADADDQGRAPHREEAAGERRADEDCHALEHARPHVPCDELLRGAREVRHERVVRRAVRPSAERDQRDEDIDEPGGAAQRQDAGGEGQRRPARGLDRQQEALPGIPVDDGRCERNRRDGGTHPDHAEDPDGGQAPFLVEVDGERDKGSPVRGEVAAPAEQEGPQPRTPQNVAEHRQAHEQRAHRPTLARPARVVNEAVLWTTWV